MHWLKQRYVGVCVLAGFASLTAAAGCSQKTDTTSSPTAPATGMGTAGAQRTPGNEPNRMMGVEPAPAGVKTDLSGGRK